MRTIEKRINSPWGRSKRRKSVFYCQRGATENSISGRIFFEWRRMPRHNIGCPSKETGNRKQLVDAIYISHPYTKWQNGWRCAISFASCLRCSPINLRRDWKRALFDFSLPKNTSNSPRNLTFDQLLRNRHVSPVAFDGDFAECERD